MRTVIVSLATAGALCALAPSVRADQCAWLDDTAVADRAARELARASLVIEYCEPCGATAPGAPFDVGTVSTRPAAPGFSEVLLDDRGVDLAYTYVLLPGARVYRNLALLAGCPADGVSPSLRIDDATSSGVLIFGDSTPGHTSAAAAAPATAPVVEQPPAPARWQRPAPQPTVIVIADARASRLVPLELLLGAALLINALIALALARRRFGAQVHLPRATLVDRD